MILKRSIYDQLVNDGIIDPTKIPRPPKEYPSCPKSFRYKVYECYIAPSWLFLMVAFVAGILSAILYNLLAYYLT